MKHRACAAVLGLVAVRADAVAGGYTPTDLVKFSAIVDRVQATQLGGLAAFLGKASK